MRSFVLIRQHTLSHYDLTNKLNDLESKFDQQFHDVSKALSFLMDKNQTEIDQENRIRIGYQINNPNP